MSAANVAAAKRRIPNPLPYVTGQKLGEHLRSNPGDKNYGRYVGAGPTPTTVIPGGPRPKRRRYPESRIDRST